jgi:hypothetical protein
MNAMANRMRPDDHSFSDILSGTSEFMKLLTKTILELENHILAKNGAERPVEGSAEHLQSIDYIRQATEEVALTLARMAVAIPHQTLARDVILHPIKLQELRDCIDYVDGPHPKADRLFERQKIELF